jgi:hypothetical protein
MARGARVRGNQTADRKADAPLVRSEGKTSMTPVAQLVATSAVKAFVNIRRLFRRRGRALIEARTRRMSYEIEFQSRVNTYRQANGMPPLSIEDFARPLLTARRQGTLTWSHSFMPPRFLAAELLHEISI